MPARKRKIGLFNGTRPKQRARTLYPCLYPKHIQSRQQCRQRHKYRCPQFVKPPQAYRRQTDQRYGDGGFTQIMKQQRNRKKPLSRLLVNDKHQRTFECKTPAICQIGTDINRKRQKYHNGSLYKTAEKKKKIRHKSVKKIRFESNIRQTNRVRNQEGRTDSLWH